ncbi:MAG: tetratricopeptide repeat protein [Psychromonas sp.]|nr:tetratricopeptide repeat protein [Alteromonadales bacterium]MCP5078002.1 tetratricopeptide repeat protein [Psychromonas sp.]
MKLKIFAVLVLCLSVSNSLLSAQQLSKYTANKVVYAQTLQGQGKYQQAITLLSELTLIDAYEQTFVDRLLGVFYWQNGNSKRASQYLSKAVISGLITAPQDWPTQKMLADIYLSQSQFSKAIEHYQQLLTYLPETEQASPVLLRLVQSHYQLHQWQALLEAELQFQKSLTEQQKGEQQTITQQTTMLRYKLAAQLQLQQHKQAQRSLFKLISLQPNELVWWQQLAANQLRLGENKQSLQTLVLALRQGVNLSEANLKTMAQLYAQQGIPEQAAKVLNQLKAIATDEQLLVQQAHYWQMAKEWQLAIDVWLKAVQFNQQHYWPLAQLLVQQGNYQQALEALEFVDNESLLAQVALLKVRIYYQLKQLDNALFYAKQSFVLDGNDRSASWVDYLQQLTALDQ